ncbi:putative hemerythrin-like protein [Hypsibius exemplaris]|uniref:Hemerythrin-like protein n=1 Tax=Hypsibius exemplaris TaxID=2072580 RepID=A0A1W0WYN7_HYPEX|nr:putative hemerythrin-like protein [Hypsibius exemplaris]
MLMMFRVFRLVICSHSPLTRFPPSCYPPVCFPTASTQQFPISFQRTQATMPQQRDLIEQILDDHLEIRAFCKEIQKHRDNPKEAIKWFHQLTWEVARHSVAEELVLYPLMEQELGSWGKQMADDSRADHQRTKDDLQFLSDASTLEEMQMHERYVKMADELLVHLDKEEREDIASLKGVASPDVLLKAGKDFKRTKHFAPTRPHPENSMKPLFETPYSLMVAPIDKLRDLFRSFPDHDAVEAVEAKATGHS